MPPTLTNIAIQNAKATQKTRRLYDERGLYLEISPSGGKWWRLKYRIDGKEKRISLGVYPDIGLKEARDARDVDRKLVAQGIDPSALKKAEKASRNDSSADSFEVVAREWHANQKPGWSERHASTVMNRLEVNVFPWLGMRPTRDIRAPELLDAIRRVEDRGAVETAHRVLGISGQVFRYAIATGRAERDVAGDLKGALKSAKPKHLPAVVEPARVGKLLRAIDAYEATPPVECALRLAPLLFVRPGELRTARWVDMDLNDAQWCFEVSKTKTPHIVPLATQAVAILKELYPLTGNREYVFPNGRSPRRPMSNNAILAALRNMGIPKEEMSGHGFRAMARTLLDEVLGFRPDIIEHQLAHAVRDPLGRAYNRTAHLQARRKMMQVWADYLEELRAALP